MTEQTVIESVRNTIQAEMRREDSVIFLGEDIGARGGVFLASDGFVKEGLDIRLGELVLNAKNGNSHKFHTFGDPALRLPFPTISVCSSEVSFLRNSSFFISFLCSTFNFSSISSLIFLVQFYQIKVLHFF